MYSYSIIEIILMLPPPLKCSLLLIWFLVCWFLLLKVSNDAQETTCIILLLVTTTGIKASSRSSPRIALHAFKKPARHFKVSSVLKIFASNEWRLHAINRLRTLAWRHCTHSPKSQVTLAATLIYSCTDHAMVRPFGGRLPPRSIMNATV